jgi:hypothetical protein
MTEPKPASRQLAEDAVVVAILQANPVSVEIARLIDG